MVVVDGLEFYPHTVDDQMSVQARINCPSCNGIQTAFIRGHFRENAEGYVRYRKCNECGHDFKTVERVLSPEHGNTKYINSNKTLFDIKKREINFRKLYSA